MPKLQPQLYHTYPEVLLPKLEIGVPKYIEATLCLSSFTYRDYFENTRQELTILDCGTGFSPDLKDPTGHMSIDPNWAIRYLRLVLDIAPRVVVIPDILGDSIGTYKNVVDYYDVFFRSLIFYENPYLLAVVQGKTKEDAREMIKKLLELSYVSWIGFPRVVHYYYEDIEHRTSYNGDVLGKHRMAFVDEVKDKILGDGRKIHILGVNSISELKWAAENGFSTDTRLATLAAVHHFDVLKTRPEKKFEIDLIKSFTSEEQKVIMKNKNLLDQIFYSYVKKS